MGHHITAILIADEFNSDVAESLDLVAVSLTSRLTMFHIDHYYTAYWQAVRACTAKLDIPPAFPVVFPNEAVVVELVADLTGLATPRFALIQTDYFGGVGDQWACAFTGARRDSDDNAAINDVLRMFGVKRSRRSDEFETVRLDAHRSSPEYLERYVALCDELGV